MRCGSRQGSAASTPWLLFLLIALHSPRLTCSQLGGGWEREGGRDAGQLGTQFTCCTGTKVQRLTQKALLADNGPQLGKLSDGGPQLGKLPVGGLSSRSEAAAPPLGDKAQQEMLRNQLEAQAKGREAKAHSGSSCPENKKKEVTLLRRYKGAFKALLRLE